MPARLRRPARSAGPAVAASSPSASADRFADIGTQRQAMRDNSLREAVPAPLASARKLPSLRAGAKEAFQPVARLATPEGLTRELAAERKRMAPYLRELAAPLPDPRRRIVLRGFDWRLKTEQDDADFSAVQGGKGDWKAVTVPHYGPPTGRATAFYRAEFTLDEASFSLGSFWVRLEGADYRARVYVNGRCLGEHEGFFATFEFEINGVARLGRNTLLIELLNDGVWQAVDGVPEGDKIYGATGPGWDGPGTGWHHCPAGMGLLGPVTIEARARVFVDDIYARPLPDLASAELCIEVYNCDTTPAAPAIEFAVAGENYPARLAPWTGLDAAQAARGRNRYLVNVPLPGARLWSPATPWLLRAQVRLRDPDGEIADTASRVFGLRTFRIDESTTPKGRIFLNNRPLRLRGANTMGYEQQSVMNGRLDELRDDLLLARLSNFNFLRLTQRPVQREVYEAADRLGVMLQTDLPIFGYLRRTQFCEAVRQAAEMARHIRGHASSILASFINEPFPGHWKKVGHRHLDRSELETFFTAAAAAMRIEHPDVALKYVDGDYDPPSEGLPDSHVYSLWYQGHALTFGKLHQGFFPAVKPDWCYGSGEYGAEGLDPLDLMRRRFPAGWLPASEGGAAAEAAWTPSEISHAQSGRHQALFYERPTTLAEWVEASQRYQAEATRWQTEAYRRHDRMVSCAIHLFIDAWPAGWMKSIMDCERRPKPAWFACRDALAPWLPMLRCDRFAVTAGEKFPVELWLANDTNDAPQGWTLRYQMEQDGKVVSSARTAARPAACAPVLQGCLEVLAPVVTQREEITLRLALCDASGAVVNDHAITVVVWPVRQTPKLSVEVVSAGGAAARLVRELKGRVVERASVIVADQWPESATERKRLLSRVAAGATLVLTELAAGTYSLLGEAIEVKPCGFSALDFVSRATGHALVEGFSPTDFRYWHDAEAGRISPLLPATFQAPTWTPILLSGEAGWGATPRPALAAAERRHGKGVVRLSLVSLAGRTGTNPVARLYANRLLGA